MIRLKIKKISVFGSLLGARRLTSYELRAKRLFAGFIFAFCGLSFAFNCFAQDKIVAVVNSDVVTQKDLNDFINFTRMQMASDYTPQELEDKIASMKVDLLDKLIEDRIILQEAKKSNVKIDESRIKSRIGELKARYGSDSAFQAALMQQGLVQADVEQRVREQLLMYRIIDSEVRSKIVVNPNEVTEFYQKNSEEFRRPQELQLHSVTAQDADQASLIFEKLKNGEAAENLPKESGVVVDKMVASKGQLRKEIEDEVFKLSPGQVSAPVKIQDKYYIFKLDNVIPSHSQSLAEVRDRVYNFLFNKKMQVSLASWIDGLKKNSYIKIFQN